MTTTAPRFARGDVALALFPHSDLRTAKLRPVLIVQADELGTGLPQLIIAMVTGQMRRTGHPSRVTVLLSTPEGRQSGLLMDSVIMTDNLATVFESEIRRRIGSLPMSAVDTALRHTLDLGALP